MANICGEKATEKGLNKQKNIVRRVAMQIVIDIPKEAFTNIKVGAWQRVHSDMLYQFNNMTGAMNL